jgi:general secretion pathway protein B
MSYILDALRKSDQQRQRQRATVPTLDTLPVRVMLPRRPAPWSSLSLGAALLLAGIALGWWRPWEQPTAATMQAVPPPPPVTSAPPPAAAPLPARPASATPITPPPAPRAVAAAPLPEPPPAAPPPPRVAAGVPDLESLPATLRQALPPLEISFLIDAPAPLDRRAMIDKTMLRPGESFGPDIFLEGISEEGVILVYQGQRFRKRFHP